jgi:tripartite-type tricarboxylate transporter receptor subunit TctC
MPITRRRLFATATATATATAAAAAFPRWARAQDFPSRTMKLICGFPPGGSGDFVARTIADEVARLLGQALVIENRPGAATNIASELVARAEPDGHTLLLGGSFSHSVNPALFTRLPYDPHRDFAPIIKVASLPTVFAVPASLPVNSLQDFIALARQQGAQWNYASAGIGSPGHIAGAYFTRAAELDLQHVPYKGGSEAVRALVAGEVQLTITSPPSVMAFVKEGRLKALALTTPGRSKLLPGIPGSDEAGLKDFNLDGWYGVFAPARTPANAVARLFTAFSAVLQLPAIVARLESQAATPEPSASVEAFTRFVADNRTAWAQIVKRSGAQLS